MNEELARCAQINFENFIRSVPGIEKHPLLIIAMAQLDESLGGKSTVEALEEKLPSQTVQ